jgi:hypothetical protein
MKLWLGECKRLNITITARDALEAIAAFQGVRFESQTQPRPQFTPTNFINALAEFIVATDQVRLKHLIYFTFTDSFYLIAT